MKVKTLVVAAGVSSPLILSGSVDAGYVGLTTADQPNPFGILVTNVYAEFDNPGDDWMQAVAGTPMELILAARPTCHYSTVTLLARFRGLSTSQPRSRAMW